MVSPIMMIVDYLDENYNPVENKANAKWKNVTHFDEEGHIEDQHMELIEELSEAVAEQGDLKQDIPASQAFSDVSKNPHEMDDHLKIGKYFDEKSDTGDDKSRTGPEGNMPRDDYNPINFTAKDSTTLNTATGIELEDNPKQLYDVSGVVPEYQEDIRITIDDPSGKENIPTIELEINNENQEELQLEEPERFDVDLKHPGRKDPGTHVNTIDASKIDNNLQISSLWKEKGDDIAPGKEIQEIEFSEALSKDSLKHPSSFVGVARYDPNTQGMTITLSGKTYDYCQLPQRVWDGFVGAPSKGVYYNRFIKRNYQCGMGEALNIYQHKHPDEFDWIDPEEMEEMKKYAANGNGGRFILAVVSGDTFTDHRPEGTEKHRRHWSDKELMQNIRTAKGKLTDINHAWQKKNPRSGGVYDANWNFKTNKGEMILWESDKEILDAIRDNVIEAVSINTGKPRKVRTVCETGECFITPEGTILGEENGVALAYVVTNPSGFKYNGETIPALPPGMKFTKIYLVE